MTILQKNKYRGRIAPTPSGYLHLGHARTFWIAQERARESKGALIFRNEDIDYDRCKPDYVGAMIEDLRWFGFEWEEGPDIGGKHIPYVQSQRLSSYLNVWGKLYNLGAIYPSPHSRKDVLNALSAPHGGGSEPVFPRHLRPPILSVSPISGPGDTNWRFRVPDGETIGFIDRRVGEVNFIAGKDFGDFIIWRKDGFPSYEMAVVTDDQCMGITEVVRGEDLLLSTARQLLLYRALNWSPPAFYHCPLLCDKSGDRLAKRHDALSLRKCREHGSTPESLRESWQFLNLTNFKVTQMKYDLKRS